MSGLSCLSILKAAPSHKGLARISNPLLPGLQPDLQHTWPDRASQALPGPFRAQRSGRRSLVTRSASARRQLRIRP